MVPVEDLQAFPMVGQSTARLARSPWNGCPLELGPGTNNAAGGSFGPSVFQITTRTRIVAPNSGRLPGHTTVQGELFSVTDFPLEAVPEPVPMISVGLGLLALGAIGRRRLTKASSKNNLNS